MPVQESEKMAIVLDSILRCYFEIRTVQHECETNTKIHELPARKRERNREHGCLSTRTVTMRQLTQARSVFNEEMPFHYTKMSQRFGKKPRGTSTTQGFTTRQKSPKE